MGTQEIEYQKSTSIWQPIGKVEEKILNIICRDARSLKQQESSYSQCKHSLAHTHKAIYSCTIGGAEDLQHCTMQSCMNNVMTEYTTDIRVVLLSW